MKEFQTSFVTTKSPVHEGNQGFAHQDVHTHLQGPGGLIGPIAQENHRPISGQTTLPDFGLQKLPGFK